MKLDENMGRDRYDVIDVHAHIFEKVSGFGWRGESCLLDNGNIRWANGDEADFLPGEFSCSFGYTQLLDLMNKSGVTKAVLLQGSYYGFCNDYIHEAQSKFPERLVGMGTFDPYCDGYLAIMRRLIEDLKFRGLKFELSQRYGLMGYHSDFLINGDRMRPVFEYAHAAGLVVSLDLGTFGEPSMQIKALEKVVRQYTSIRFVLEHLFSPPKDSLDIFMDTIARFSDYDHVSFTVAALPVSTKPEKYPYPAACQFVETAKRLLGATRLMWGSDVPTTLLYAKYQEQIGFMDDSGIFSEDELRDIYSGNAKRIYRL
jgi:hypothetical protein